MLQNGAALALGESRARYRLAHFRLGLNGRNALVFYCPLCSVFFLVLRLKDLKPREGEYDGTKIEERDAS